MPRLASLGFPPLIVGQASLKMSTGPFLLRNARSQQALDGPKSNLTKSNYQLISKINQTLNNNTFHNMSSTGIVVPCNIAIANIDDEKKAK